MDIIGKALTRCWESIARADKKRLAGQTPPGGIIQVTDIPYLNDDSPWHRLDIYYPEGTTAALPVILDIHGGGLMYGDKELNKNYCLHLAQRGFTVINMSYRLVPDVLFPDQVRDVMAAFHWLAENGSDYPCDMQNLFATGDSAGGLLCAYCALVETSRTLQLAYGVAPSGLTFRALGLTSGMFELKTSFTRLMRRTCLGRHYKKKAVYPYLDFADILPTGSLPPCYLVTSDQDFLQKHSIRFAELLRQNEIPHALRNWSEKKPEPLAHVFSVAFPDREESVYTIGEMTNYFRAHLAAFTHTA